MTSVGIIGAGAVGQAVGQMLACSGRVRQILVASRRLDQAAALAADLEDMCRTLETPVQIGTVHCMADMRGCDALIVAARASFANRRCVDVRMGGLVANAPLMRELGLALAGYAGAVLVVTNPVDVMVRVFSEAAGGGRIFGVGGGLDTARYRVLLAAALSVSPDQLQCHVVGEHGDHAVCCLRATEACGSTIELDPAQHAAVVGRIHSRSLAIQRGLGRVRAGAAGAVVSALWKVLGVADGVGHLSVPSSGGVWFGHAVTFQAGQAKAWLPELSATERARVDAAVSKLQAAYSVAQRYLGPHEGDSAMTIEKSGLVYVQAATASATVASQERGVLDWIARYFGTWWQADTSGAVRKRSVRVHAVVDAPSYQRISHSVMTGPHETAFYGGRKLHVGRRDGTLTACDDTSVAFMVPDDGPISITGAGQWEVAMATCRLARDAVRGLLARDGWVLLHASAVVHNESALLALGGKGSGKTSTALQLAATGQWKLIANDRVFVRDDGCGALDLLPWPAAAAVGLGLLAAAGWYDAVAQAGATLHPTTKPPVLRALARGERRPLYDGTRELKAQLYPDQLQSLLGLGLGCRGKAAGLLFPTVVPEANPALAAVDRQVDAADLFSGATEDRYPNVFGLSQPEPANVRDAVLTRLNRLPRKAVTLSHDVEANAVMLARLSS